MPSALTYPGVYVEEIPSGVRTITGVATSVTAFVGACNCACRLSSVTPTEVVKVPEGVSREDEVPDWQGEEIDQHP